MTRSLRLVRSRRGVLKHGGRLDGRMVLEASAAVGAERRGARIGLVAEITYLMWTADGLLRHTVYVGLHTESRRRMSDGKPREFGRAQILSSAEEMSPMRLMDRIGGRILTFIGAGCWRLRIPVGFSKHNLLNICVNCHPIVSYSVL
jgi:hypothetical protein